MTSIVIVQLVIMFLGLFLMGGALATALHNMSEMVDPANSFEDGFKTHLKTMGLMALGSVMVFGSIIWNVVVRCM